MDLKKIIILGSVGLVSAAIGITIPTVMSGKPAEATTEQTASHDDKTGHEAADSHAKADAGHDAAKPAAAPPKADAHGGHGGHGGDKETAPKPREGPQFIEFAQIVVNLNEPLLIKTISIDISVQTDGKYYDDVDAALKAKGPMLKTWLTSHLADKNLEDIRGKVGFNRLRREIQDNFNSLLFKDGHERIQDIMFEEYHVQ